MNLLLHTAGRWIHYQLSRVAGWLVVGGAVVLAWPYVKTGRRRLDVEVALAFVPTPRGLTLWQKATWCKWWCESRIYRFFEWMATPAKEVFA